MTTGKTIALTRQTFVGKLMFLLFNMLSRFVIAFLPKSKHILISWVDANNVYFNLECYKAKLVMLIVKWNKDSLSLLSWKGGCISSSLCLLGLLNLQK